MASGQVCKQNRNRRLHANRDTVSMAFRTAPCISANEITDSVTETYVPVLRWGTMSVERGGFGICDRCGMPIWMGDGTRYCWCGGRLVPQEPKELKKE